jgi:hypothetical protein
MYKSLNVATFARVKIREVKKCQQERKFKKSHTRKTSIEKEEKTRKKKKKSDNAPFEVLPAGSET